MKVRPDALGLRIGKSRYSWDIRVSEDRAPHLP